MIFFFLAKLPKRLAFNGMTDRSGKNKIKKQPLLLIQ
jgi:hypothetical protein